MLNICFKGIFFIGILKISFPVNIFNNITKSWRFRHVFSKDVKLKSKETRNSVKIY